MFSGNAMGLKNHPMFSDLATHIVDKFFQYHQSNPKVYELFKFFCKQLKGSGREYYGAKSVAERIRWHTGVETKGEEFKIGNNHISCCARLLMIEDANFIGFFSTRKSPGTVPAQEFKEEFDFK